MNDLVSCSFCVSHEIGRCFWQRTTKYVFVEVFESVSCKVLVIHNTTGKFGLATMNLNNPAIKRSILRLLDF